MKSYSENTYEHVKNSDGADYYCETGTFRASAGPADDLTDRCVEADVVRRYSGNILVKG